MEISGSGSLDAASVRRCTIEIEGVVQGVGFRPHVYRTAVRHGLAGSVRNSLRGALVEVEGDENSLRRFFEEVTASLAAAARRPRVTVRWDAPRGAGDTFSIGGSARDGEARLFPSPDLAVCDTCLGELSDPCDRRHGYALLTCAECGPRFTMVAALPYDRERTTMGGLRDVRALPARV